MEKIDICNNVLDLVGQGSHINTLEEQSKEADLFRRNFDVTVKRCLMKANFNFARKDEVITSDNELDYVSLPWKHTYSLPSDCLRVLYLDEIDADSNSERIRHDTNRFNFRQIGTKTTLATDKVAPFTVHYIANVTDTELFNDAFTEALEYLLGARVASALIHGTTGVQVGQTLLQQGMMLLYNASAIDAQQGGDSIQQIELPDLIKSRN